MNKNNDNNKVREIASLRLVKKLAFFHIMRKTCIKMHIFTPLHLSASTFIDYSCTTIQYFVKSLDLFLQTTRISVIQKLYKYYIISINLYINRHLIY